ncbi:MAG: DUF4422 domain-containing protein [Alphaproteobacteria bacterium]|nr:DUF4422 domain-containing protein [Alphaproteobacteria bacterium]
MMKQKWWWGCILLLVLLNLGVMHVMLFAQSSNYKNWIVAIGEKIKAPQVKIFVTYYKPYRIPTQTKVLVPMQVGRAIEKQPFMGGQLSSQDIVWLHQHMIGDDSGENISAKNRQFDVLTAYYWVWKHYKEIGNPAYVGFFAHRKMLNLQEQTWGHIRFWAADFGFEEQKILALFKDYDAIVYSWQARDLDSADKKVISFYEQYRSHHHVADLEAMVKPIKQRYPEMVPAMNEVLFDTSKEQSVWNYWIMKKELAFDYFEKLFVLMFELERQRSAIVAEYDILQQRVYGYLAERFFAIWLRYKQQTAGVSVFSTDVVYL